MTTSFLSRGHLAKTIAQSGRLVQHRLRTSCLTSLRRSSSASGKDSTSLIRVTEENGVRTIVLNNPKTRNALSLPLLTELSEHLQETPSLRCVLITSVGDVFSAGHDLKELTSGKGSDYHREVFQRCTDVMLSIKNLPVPVIAQVKGIAAAAGCQLVAATDIVIASDEALFSTPGAKVGLFCSTPGIPLARSASRKVSAYMLFTGNFISAQEALRAGLVSRVVPADKLDEETSETVAAICHKSKSVISLGKKFLEKQINLSLEDAYAQGCQVMVDNLTLMDAQEGIDAFLAKRTPVWTHSQNKASIK